MSIKVLNEFLPIAEDVKLGAIKVGETLGIDETGELNLQDDIDLFSKITNCFTELPSANLELVDGLLTLKANSVIYVPAGVDTFNRVTVKNDVSSSISTTDGQYLIYAGSDGSYIIGRLISKSVSGSAKSITATYMAWYDTVSNTIKNYTSDSTTPTNTISFPIATVTILNSKVVSIDQLFGGIGFIGSIVFVLPGVRALIPAGRKTNGNLQNDTAYYDYPIITEFTTDATYNLGFGKNKVQVLTTASTYDNDKNYNTLNGETLDIAACGKVTIESGSVSSLSIQPVFHAVNYADLEKFEPIGDLGALAYKDKVATADITSSGLAQSAINNLTDDLANRVVKNSDITAGTNTKITYDAKGLVTKGESLSISDIPNLNLAKITDVTATAAEVNTLKGITATVNELNVLDGITATTAELNYTDGVTSNIQTQLDKKLDKVDYEWNKSINFGSTGKLCIGKFCCYDTNLTVDIDATTNTTYHASLVIAMQNIGTSGGYLLAKTYEDANNTVTPNIYIYKHPTNDCLIEIYFSPTAWTKNLIHIRATGLSKAHGTVVYDTEYSDICTSVDSIPAEATIKPTNALDTKQDLLVSATNIKTINKQSILGEGNLDISTTVAFADITGQPTDNTNLSTALSSKLTASDITNNVTSTATDKALSANMGKELQDQITNLKSIGRFLSLWDSTTGLPTTNPTTSPYTYHTGDYYIVSKVGDTNYKPDGASYTTGTASTVVETETVSVNDLYVYSGTTWNLLINTQRTVTFASISGSPSDNTNLKNALDAKQDNLPSQTSQSGKFLTTNGTTLSWANVDAFPSQTGNSGKVLTTNGTSVSWGNKTYRGVYAASTQYYAGEIVKYNTNFYIALKDTIDVIPTTTTDWGRIDNTDEVNIDNITITKNTSGSIQAVGLIDKNKGNAKYDWIGTKAEYDALKTKDNTWTYYITDDETEINLANVDLSNLSSTGNTRILPSQANQAGKYLKTDGTNASWSSIPSKISELTDDTSINPINKANTLTNLTATITELNYVDGVTSNIQTQLDNKVTKNSDITGATKTKITYDSKGLVTKGEDLAASDIPDLSATYYSTTNPSKYISGIDSTMVTTALGYTPYNSTNPNNYISGITSLMVTTALGYTPQQAGNYVTTDTEQSITGHKTFTGRVDFSGSGDDNAVYLTTNTRFDVKDTTNTILGFANSTFLINHPSYALNLRGSATRPQYNSNDLALYSDTSNKVVANTAITGAQKCKITYDSKGLVTAGADLSSSDIPSIPLSKISDVTATATEVNYLSGVTASVQTQLNGKLTTSDIIDNVTSTDTNKALSANQGKVLSDRLDNVESRGRYLSQWNCATGLPVTNPDTDPYTHKTGDYYIIGTIAESGKTNYRPSGSTYNRGVASTVVETDTVAVNDTYLYDGINWILQVGIQKDVSFASITGLPTDNANLSTALSNKVTKNSDITASSTEKLVTYDAKGLVTGGKTISESLGYTPANDSNVVHTTGDENIAGIKNYTDEVTITGTNNYVELKNTGAKTPTLTAFMRRSTSANSTDNMAFGLLDSATEGKPYKATISIYYDTETQKGWAVGNGLTTTEDSTTSTQIDTVGSRNTKLQDYVDKTNAQEISGYKTFSNTSGILRKATTIDTTTTSGEKEEIVMRIVDKNGVGVGQLSGTRSGTANTFRLRAINSNITYEQGVTSPWADIRTRLYDNKNASVSFEVGVGMTNTSLTNSSTSTTDTTIPCMGWVNSKLAGYVVKNGDITASTSAQLVTYDAKGLVTGGRAIAASDIPDLSATYQPTLPTGTTGYFLQKTENGVGWASVEQGGITSVTHDTTLTGSGTSASPLSVADLSSTYYLASNPSNYITLNDVPKEVFIATYGTTTLAEIITAYNAGKACFVDDGTRMVALISVTSSLASFLNLITTSTAVKITCDSSNAWSNSTLHLSLDNLTASKVLVSDTNGYSTTSSVTSTELGYLSGVTSAIQTQINGKVTANSAITAATTKKLVTYDSKGLVTAGADLSGSDVTTALGYTPYNSTNPNGYVTADYHDSTKQDTLPTYESGKFLTNNGTTLSWGTVDALPSQSGQNGKFLTTNGTTASWATVDALPSQTGMSGKFLTTDGSTASWADATSITIREW